MPSLAEQIPAQPPVQVLDRLLAFVRLLRANGLDVSPAEAADAARAVALLPEILTERAVLEAALGGTLVKRVADRPLFATLFAAFFLDASKATEPAANEHGHDHEHGSPDLVGIDVAAEPGVFAATAPPRHEHGTRIDLRRFFGEGGSSAAGDDHHAGDRLRLTWLGRDTLFDRVGRAPPADAGLDGGFGLRRLRTAGRPGALRPDIGGSLEVSRDIVLRGSGDERGAPTDQDADVHLRSLVETSATAAQRWMRQSSARSSPTGTRFSAEDLDPPDLGWEALTAADLAALERTVARLGRKLGGAAGHRRPRRAGRLDGAATMRRAAATDGVPLRPVFIGRAWDRPRLVVLCDVSLSVRGAARFLLRVSAAAQRGSGRVRTFAFVRDVAEMTHVLQRADLDHAIGEVFGDRLLDTAEASDGGAALRAFVAKFGAALTPRTTVLMLGDGRNNGRDLGLDALAEVRRRCRRLIWLSPEGRASWGLGGCDLPRYAVHCDIVASVRSPAELDRFVTTLKA